MASGRLQRFVYQACVVIIVGVLVVAAMYDDPAGEGVLIQGEVTHINTVGDRQYSLTVKTTDGIIRVTGDRDANVGEVITLRERRTSIFKRKRHTLD